MNTNRPAYEDSHDADQIPFLEHIIILAKHSRMIIFTSAAATVLVFLLLVILPDKFEATTRILPPTQNMTMSGQILESLGGGSVSSGAAGGGAGAMGGLAATLLGLKAPADLYIGMLKSDTVFDRIIGRFNLKEYYGARNIEDARKQLDKRAEIAAKKTDGIINVEVTSYSPKLSAEMANAFVEELDRLLQEMATKEAEQRLSFLEKERLQASQNLSKAEEALRSFSEKNSVLQIETQTRGVLEYIARLRAEIDGKEVGIQVLKQQATSYNFDVVRMETEVKGLREKLRSAESQYDNCITDVCVPTGKAPGLALEYVRLYREAKFQETLYQLFLKLVEIGRLDTVRDNTIIQVVDVAKPPERKSNRRGLPSVASGIVTFFIMIMVVLGRERIKRSEDNLDRLRRIKESLGPWRNMWMRVKNKIWFKKRY
jgi:capsule polysaccharide export protein KpsE/RkpR